MKKLLSLLLFIPYILIAQIPSYYSTIDFSQSSESIKTQLNTLITNTHTTLIPYTSSATDTWDIVKQSDLESSTSNNVILLYGYNDTDGISKTDRLRSKDLSCHTSSCTGLWTREHIFAKSLATPSLDTSYPSAGTDVHNLRACDSQMNTSRNNRIFEDGTGNSHITSLGNFYPGDEYKGDIARIIMYMYLRYPTQCLPTNIGYGTTNYATLNDIPDVFLDWNVEDPLSQFEIDRNDIIYQNQGNRNPFIDNPYIATLIWNGAKAIDTWNTLAIEKQLITEVKIYPTLVKDYIYINSNTAKTYNYSIYNTLGQKVKQAITKKQINISTLKNGIYYLNIGNDNKVFSKKIIKV